MHSIYQAKPLLDSALVDQVGHRVANVHKPTPARNFKPKMLGKALHMLFLGVPKSSYPSNKILQCSAANGLRVRDCPWKRKHVSRKKYRVWFGLLKAHCCPPHILRWPDRATGGWKNAHRPN